MASKGLQGLIDHHCDTCNRKLILPWLSFRYPTKTYPLQVTFLMMPLEIGWNATVSWHGGDFLCRICAFFRIFGLFLSSNIVMCISIDR